MKKYLLLAVGLLLANSFLFAQRQATIKLDSVWGCPGDTVQVPVRVYGVSRSGMTFFQTNFVFKDTSAVEVLTHDWNGTRGTPVLTDFDEDILSSGILVTNHVVRSEDTTAMILIAYVANDPWLNKFREEGHILFKLNFVIKKTVPEVPVKIQYTILGRNNTASNQSEEYNVSWIHGNILAKSVPKVKVADKNEVEFVNFRMCVDRTLQLEVSGAERYEWTNYPLRTHHWGYGEENQAPITASMLNRNDVYNPIFTPPTELPYEYRLLVKGYNSDGCFTEDEVSIHALWHRFYPVQPKDHYFVHRDSTLRLEMIFDDPEAYGGTRVPRTYKWFPEHKVENPRDSVTRTLPVGEPTWFWGQVTDASGCVGTVNVKVDVYGDTMIGFIERNSEKEFFCSDAGKTQNTINLAALVYGGAEEKTYEWSFQKLYDNGNEPVFTDGTGTSFVANTKSTTLIFYGTTEVSVVIKDFTGRSLTVTDTIFVYPITPVSITIDLDEKSKIQEEIGYCVNMPLTYVATLQNAGENPKIYWEVNGYRTTLDGLTPREGAITTFPSLEPQHRVRAIVYATSLCPDQPYTYSNVKITPTDYYQITGIYIGDSTDDAHRTCNRDSALIFIHAHNPGDSAIFQIFRNDELIDTFVHFGGQSEFAYPAKSLNYWDRFSVRFFNTSCRCLVNNGHLSNYMVPALRTTSEFKTPKIVSDMGGTTICDTTNDIYTLRLAEMEQFGRGTTVIWMLNDKEWGRYEFDANVSAQLPVQPEKHHAEDFVINQYLEQDEQTSFYQKYAFPINGENFPTVRQSLFPSDSIWAIVITRTECGEGAGNYVIDTVPAIKPTFAMPEPATLNITPATDLNICKGEDITFTANAEKAGDYSIDWYWNERKMETHPTSYTLKEPENGDSLVAILTSNYKCATNLPLRVVVKPIVVNDFPELTVQKDTTICVGESIVLNPTCESQVSYAWRENPTLSAFNIQNPVATPTEQMTVYYLTVTDENNCESTDSLIVRTAIRDTVKATIRLEMPSDTLICRKNDGIEFICDFTPATTYTNIRWFKNGFGLSDAPNSRTLTLNGILDGDEIQVQVTKPNLNTCMPKTVMSEPIKIRVMPEINGKIKALNDDAVICGEDSVTLTATGGISYRWETTDPKFNNSMAETIVVKPEATTTYTLHATDEREICQSSDQITVYVDNYVEVEADIQLKNRTNPMFCKGSDNTFTFEITPQGGGTSPQYEWYLNDAKIYQPNLPTYTGKLNSGDRIYCMMTASSDIHTCGNNVAVSETITITENPVPSVEFSEDTTVCSNEPVQLLASGVGEYRYEWFPKTGLSSDTIANPIAIVDKMVRYTVRATNEYGCSSLFVDAITVSVYPSSETLKVNVSASMDSLCIGETMTMNMTSNIEGIISWYVNSEKQSATSASFDWNPNNGDSIYAILETAVKCLPESSKRSNLYVARMFTPPSIDLTERYDTICTFDTTTVTATSDYAKHFLWETKFMMSDNRQATVHLFPTIHRTYTVRSHVGNCWSTNADTISIHVNPLPRNPPQMEDIIVCGDATADLIIENPQSLTLYHWYSTENPDEKISTGTALYDVSIGDYFILTEHPDNGCMGQYTENVSVVAGIEPFANIRVITATDNILAKTLIEFENESDNWEHAYWNFGDTDAFVEYNTEKVSYIYENVGTYNLMLKVQSQDACLDSMQITLDVLPQMDEDIWTPSAFMPASSNPEDRVFKVYGENIESLTLSIYALNGQELFSTQALDQGWDGTHKGTEMPTGNYTYVVVAKIKGKEVKKSGSVTLIR